MSSVTGPTLVTSRFDVFPPADSPAKETKAIEAGRSTEENIGEMKASIRKPPQKKAYQVHKFPKKEIVHPERKVPINYNHYDWDNH
jgi:hypothetical protein